MSASYKKNIGKNVAANWGAQFIQVLSGFVLPRLINDELGQDHLGTWDFAWSVVSYFNLLQLNATATVSRYIARYTAKNDNLALSQIASTSIALYTFLALISFTLCSTLSTSLKEPLNEKLPNTGAEAATIIFVFGIFIAFRLFSSPFAGFLTGYHRWTVHNGIFISSNIVALLTMLLILNYYPSIVALSIAYTSTFCLGSLVRIIYAIRTTRNVRYSYKYVNTKSLTKMARFSGKSILPMIGKLTANQGINILIALKLGPAALALYSRPVSLIRHLDSFLHRYSMVLMPSSSEIHGSQDYKQLREMALTATKYGNAIALPGILLFIFLGETLIALWMGRDYIVPGLISVLALGQAFRITYSPLICIVAGTNNHGKTGIASFIASILSLFLGYIALFKLELDLLSASYFIVAPIALAYSLYMPIVACNILKIKVSHFIIKTWKLPILCTLPNIIVLLVAKTYYTSEFPSELTHFAILFSSTIFCIFLYWLYILPQIAKRKFRNMINL